MLHFKWRNRKKRIPDNMKYFKDYFSTCRKFRTCRNFRHVETKYKADCWIILWYAVRVEFISVLDLNAVVAKIATTAMKDL